VSVAVVVCTAQDRPLPADLSDVAAGLANGDPETARRFYQRYAPGVRFFFRRAHPDHQIDEAVFRTLLEATRRLRRAEWITDDSIGETVLACTRREAELLHLHVAAAPLPSMSLTLSRQTELVNQMLTEFTGQEREVLLRSLVLNQSDSAVAQELEINRSAIPRILAIARQRFRALCDQAHRPVRVALH
jgi:hypothetical protein